MTRTRWRTRCLALVACLLACAGCLRANFGGSKDFGPWIVAVAVTFAGYLCISMP